MALSRANGDSVSGQRARRCAQACHPCPRIKTPTSTFLERLSERGEATGAALVIREAVDRGWAVSVWPAHEGPPELGLHVADRLTFLVAVGPDAPRDPLVDLREALQRVGAVARDPEQSPGWIAADDNSEYHCSIARFGAPRPPSRAAPLARVASIGVTASPQWLGRLTLRRTLLTRSVWVSPVHDRWPQRHTASVRLTRSVFHRLEMLRYLLVRPQPLHVSYHFSSVDTRGSADDPLVEAVEEGLAPDIVIVRLRETDLLLDEAISTIRNGSLPSPTLGRLRTLRAIEDNVVRENTKFISIDVDGIGAVNIKGGPFVAGRETRFLRSMLVTGGADGTPKYKANYSQWFPGVPLVATRSSLQTCPSLVRAACRPMRLGRLAEGLAPRPPLTVGWRETFITTPVTSRQLHVDGSASRRARFAANPQARLRQAATPTPTASTRREAIAAGLRSFRSISTYR